LTLVLGSKRLDITCYKNVSAANSFDSNFYRVYTSHDERYCFDIGDNKFLSTASSGAPTIVYIDSRCTQQLFVVDQTNCTMPLLVLTNGAPPSVSGNDIDTALVKAMQLGYPVCSFAFHTHCAPYELSLRVQNVTRLGNETALVRTKRRVVFDERREHVYTLDEQARSTCIDGQAAQLVADVDKERAAALVALRDGWRNMSLDVGRALACDVARQQWSTTGATLRTVGVRFQRDDVWWLARYELQQCRLAEARARNDTAASCGSATFHRGDSATFTTSVRCSDDVAVVELTHDGVLTLRAGGGAECAHPSQAFRIDAVGGCVEPLPSDGRTTALTVACNERALQLFGVPPTSPPPTSPAPPTPPRRCQSAADCAARQLCDDDGVCIDRTPAPTPSRCTGNFVGELCDQCATGYYGAGCNRRCTCVFGTCDGGVDGTGGCVSCDDDYYGDNCELRCQCEFGTCDAGVASDGRCATCNAGYFGADCERCACRYGTCNDGIGGNGECSECATSKLALPLCDRCIDDDGLSYGIDCAPCQCEANVGECLAGPSGSGKCASCNDDAAYGPLCTERCDGCRSNFQCSTGPSGVGCVRENAALWLHEIDQPPDYLALIAIVPALAAGALGLGAAAHKGYTPPKLFSRPHGWQAWLTHPLIALAVVVLCMTWTLLISLLAMSSYANNRRDADRSGTAKFFNFWLYPAVEVIGIGIKSYTLIANFQLLLNLAKAKKAEKTAQPNDENIAQQLLHASLERRKLWLLKAIFVTITFVVIGLAPLGTVLAFDVFTMSLQGDEAAFADVHSTTTTSGSMLIAFLISAGVIAGLALLAFFAAKKSNTENAGDGICDCCWAMQLVNVCCCLVAFLLFGAFVFFIQQYGFIAELVQIDFDFEPTFWLTLAITHIFLAADIAITILLMLNQIGAHTTDTGDDDDDDTNKPSKNNVELGDTINFEATSAQDVADELHGKAQDKAEERFEPESDSSDTGEDSTRSE
jgi:hypothetical protein